MLEGASPFLDVLRENDDPLHAPRLGLRECQVVLVVLGDPDVDEVTLVSQYEGGRVKTLPVTIPIDEGDFFESLDPATTQKVIKAISKEMGQGGDLEVLEKVMRKIFQISSSKGLH